MNKILLLCSFFLAIFATSSGQSKEDLLKAESLRFKAQVSKDSGYLKQVLDKDLVYLHSSGKKDDRQSYIASLFNGQLSYLSIDPEEMNAVIDGKIAWITGKARAKVKVESGQELNLHLSYLDVYKYHDGRWQMVAWQSTRLPE